jgi:hypothetical protein
MAWIESHQALGRHPKTLRLAAELGCTLPTAVGYLQFLWWWALDYAQDGVVEPDAKALVGRACEWRGRPDRFWTSLITAGFVDPLPGGGVQVHDWAEYAGRLIDKRTKDAERKRQGRAVATAPELRTSTGNPTDIGRTSGSASNGRPAYQPTNQPEPTGQNQPETPPTPPDEQGGPLPSRRGRRHPVEYDQTPTLSPQDELKLWCPDHVGKFSGDCAACRQTELEFVTTKLSSVPR